MDRINNRIGRIYGYVVCLTAIDSGRFHAVRSLVANLLLIIFAGIVFGVHWQWLRQRDTLPAAP